MVEDQLTGKTNLDINEIIDQCCAYFDGNQRFSDALLRAKEAFFQKTGKISEKDQNFTIRMNAFLHWFAFNWKLAPIQVTPYEVFLENLRGRKNTPQFEALRQQRDHIHSLFKFVKFNKKGSSVIKDLYSGTKYEVPDQNALFGVDKGTFFETRLYQVDGVWTFASYYIFHPLEARRGITKKVKSIKKSREPFLPFLMKLQSYNYKWNKYRSIDIKSIYHFDDSYPKAK